MPNDHQAPPSRKKPGPKPRGEHALSGAERQANYRQKLKKDADPAGVKLEKISRVALVTQLGEALAKLEVAKTEKGRATWRKVIGDAMGEIARRYEIAIPSE